ncbi:uncharacterized protein LOC134715366 [Mytilus trossulus]|uniref:uncharacterized protein LOC134715366 n=1 Tax=Mytilus trossulus TaxID=6551 RepID=UPI003006CB82
METVLLKPKDILLHMCQSEENLWTQRDASESSVSTDLGSSILRECKCLRKIHDHFSNLNKRKCCMSLAVCKTTFSNFRVVRNDGRDNGIEEGAMSKTLIDNSQLVSELDEKEFRVFRYAYMCASYPVLGAPDPPSPQTPPITPTGQGHIRIQFKDLKSQIMRTQSGDDAEDETSIVPAETLFELLRRVFRLSPNTFYQYEVYIRNSYGKRDAEPNRILAEELVGQLASLENNSNPYYTPKHFMTQFGYDRWQRKEFIHIAELMRKFWHVAHPHKRNNHIQFLQTVHDDYVVLMEKLLRYESAYRQADNTQTTLLSSASIRLLKEFGLRYGVGELYRRIVYLRYLVSNFDPSVWLIQHCIFGVIFVLEILPNREDMVRKELEILCDSIKKLQSKALTTLSNMKSVFPDNKPSNGIDMLISLMEKTLEAQVHLKIPKVEMLDDLIVQCIKETFLPSYEKMKLVAKTDLKQDRNGYLTPSLLNMVIGKIRDEVSHYRTYYQGTFSRYCNVTELAAQSLYTLFMDDLQLFFKVYDAQPTSKTIDRQLLGLGYRLHDLDNDWNQYVSGHPSSYLWREFFYKQSLHWLSILKALTQQSVLLAVGLDRFTTQCFDDIGSTYQVSLSSVSSPRDRTMSLKSITPSINSAFSGLVSSNSTPVYSNIWSHPGDVSQSNVQTSAFKPKTSESIKTTSSFNHRYNPETRSLDGTEDTEHHLIEEAEAVTFSSLRSCSSLPDNLSKSYDHYLNVPRKVLSLSRQIDTNQNRQSDENQENEERSRTLAEKIMYEISPMEDYRREHESEEKEITIILDKKKDKNINPIKKGHKIEVVDSSNSLENGDKEDTAKKVESVEQYFKTDNFENDFKRGDGRKESVEHDNKIDNFETTVKIDDVTKIECVEKDYGIDKVKINDNEGVVNDKNTHNDEKGEKADDIENDINEDDIEMDHTDSDHSDHSDEFSFPPLSEIAQTDDQPSLYQDPVKTVIKNVVHEEPRPIKTVPLVPYSDSDQSENVGNIKTASPKLIRPIAHKLKAEPAVRSISSCSNASSKVKKTAVLPVSGSVLDIVVILQRLVEFSQTLCQSFVQSVWTVGTYQMASISSYEMKRKLHETNIKMMNNILHLYANNILCFDLCGTTNSEARKLTGSLLMDDLQTMKSKDMIWGCRHNLSGQKDCFHYLKSKAELLSDRYEPVTKDMCTRINNVFMLLECIDVYYKRLGNIFKVTTEVTHRSQQQKSTDSDDWKEQTSQNPSDFCHISHVVSVLCRIMAYRINLFVNDAVTVLLSLKRLLVPVEVCLLPLTQFLQSYINSLQEWLYRSCYRRVMEFLWIFIVRNFEKQVFEVLKGDHGSVEYAQLLIQAFTHLMKFMTEQKRTIRVSLLLPEAENVMFRLQLCATATNQLITLYRHVIDYYNDDDCTDFTVHLILHKLREDLLKYRKCFSGSEFVKWIMENHNLIKPLSSQLGLPTDYILINKEIAALMCRRFLESNLIVDAEIYDEHDQDNRLDLDTSLDATNYPQLSIMENEQNNRRGDNSSIDSDATPTDTYPKTQYRVHGKTLVSPAQLPRQANRSFNKPVFQLSCDTPMSFSTLFNESDGPVFENCDNHFYYIATMTTLHNAENHEPPSELDILVDQCFQSHISSNYLLHIIYSRRKFDSCAKVFLQNQSASVLRKLKADLEDHTSCEIS